MASGAGALTIRCVGYRARAVHPVTQAKLCVKIAHMDMTALGRRLASSREVAGMTQTDLAQAVGLDRSAVSRMEKGERKLSVPELVTVAQALGRPLAFFVDEPVTAVVNRRRDAEHSHGHTSHLDDELRGFASDVRFLMEMGLAVPVQRPQGHRVPHDHDDAERRALALRQQLDLGHAPLTDLGRISDALGLFTLVTSLGQDAPDGACVEISEDAHTLGVAVLNADKGSGRRRMTIAHEMGHWLFGDAYDIRASTDSERLIQSFAVHLLAPRNGVTVLWNQKAAWTVRDRALAVSATYRLSWSAAVGQLRNLDLIDYPQYASLTSDKPRRGEFDRLGLDLHEDLACGYISPAFRSAVLNGYSSGVLTEARTLELLRGALDRRDLPLPAAATDDDLQAALVGHG